MHFIKSKTILGKNNNINLYRGCSFGCIYCDARSSCYHVDNFEDIGVKENAIKILDKELASKKVPVLITTGAMSDPYCKLEETLGVTRKMLELFIKYRCGVMFLTKSTLALRDLDLYKKINEQAKVLASFT
ncbi:MAG: radical SAM protein, partial [Bacilli bacterium]